MPLHRIAVSVFMSCIFLTCLLLVTRFSRNYEVSESKQWERRRERATLIDFTDEPSGAREENE